MRGGGRDSRGWRGLWECDGEEGAAMAEGGGGREGKTWKVVDSLNGKTTARKELVRGCGWCRGLYGRCLVDFPDGADAVRVVERYADGEADDSQYDRAVRGSVMTIFEPADGDISRQSREMRQAHQDGHSVWQWLQGPWRQINGYGGAYRDD